MREESGQGLGHLPHRPGLVVGIVGHLGLPLRHEAGGRVINAPVHRLAEQRLSLDRNDPQLTFFETAEWLDRSNQLVAVEVAVPKIPSQDGPAKNLALVPFVLVDLVDRDG